MLRLSEFIWTLCCSVLVVFNNFLLIDATARSKSSSNQKRFFIALSLFFANTPFKNDRQSFKNKKIVRNSIRNDARSTKEKFGIFS